MFKANNIFIVNFEHIPHLFSSVSVEDFEQVNVNCVILLLFLITFNTLPRGVFRTQPNIKDFYF